MLTWPTNTATGIITGPTLKLVTCIGFCTCRYMVALFQIGAVEMKLELYAKMVHKSGNQPPYEDFNARKFVRDRSKVACLLNN